MNITFEQIQKANETIQTTNIKGKEYAEVNQRIKAFRMVYPEGFIIPQIINNENGVCMYEAEVGYYKEDGTKIVLGKGSASEKENSSFINKTSYTENCETSAVGRALGMAGFGIDTSIRSAEEMQNADLQQEDIKLITKSQLNVLQRLIKELPNSKEFYENTLTEFDIKDLTQLTAKQHGKLLTEIKNLQDKK